MKFASVTSSMFSLAMAMCLARPSGRSKRDGRRGSPAVRQVRQRRGDQCESRSAPRAVVNLGRVDLDLARGRGLRDRRRPLSRRTSWGCAAVAETAGRALLARRRRAALRRHRRALLSRHEPDLVDAGGDVAGGVHDRGGLPADVAALSAGGGGGVRGAGGGGADPARAPRARGAGAGRGAAAAMGRLGQAHILLATAGRGGVRVRGGAGDRLPVSGSQLQAQAAGPGRSSGARRSRRWTASRTAACRSASRCSRWRS